MNQTSHSGSDGRASDSSSAATAPPARLASSKLLRGRRKLIIDHGDATYVLLLTHNVKLVLNK